MNLNLAKNKLKTILKDNKNIRRIRSNRWLIRWNSLYNYKTSDKIFSKKWSNSWKKYNLEILLDCSWSMWHWHWLWRSSAIYISMLMLKDLIKLFKWIVDINIYWYNLIERHFTNQYIEKFDMDNLSNFNKASSFLWMNDMKEEDNEYKYSQWWGLHSWAWNFDIINLYNSFIRLSKKEWEKIIIIIWDWEMRCDYRSNEVLIQKWFKICWHSLSKINPNNSKEIASHIEKDWIKVLWIWIWWGNLFNYLSNKIHIASNNTSSLFEEVINFLKKTLK